MKVGIYEGDDSVTNVETVTFDSTSADMNQWKKTVSLTLEGRGFGGKKVFDANPDIVAFLQQAGALLQSGQETHAYPVCWRC